MALSLSGRVRPLAQNSSFLKNKRRSSFLKNVFCCREEATRTPDLLVPNEVR